MRLKQYLIFFLVSCLTFIPLLSGCIDSDDKAETETVSGKVAQEYVNNATVFWDMDNDFELDANEEKYSAQSDADGDFSVEVPKNSAGGQLVAINGTVGDSDRTSLPMMATKDADNITAVTSLVKFVPNLKDDIGDNWDADIANPDGVDGKIMQLALSAESMQSALANAGFPTAEQFSAMSQLSENLVGKDLNKAGSILDATRQTLRDYKGTIEENTSKTMFKSLNSTIMSGVESVTQNVDANSWVKESDVQDRIGNQIYFKPDSNSTKAVVPVPSDLVWDGFYNNGNIDNSTETETELLYSALERLDLKGVSPNTPISIPISSDAEMNMNNVSDVIKVYDMTTVNDDLNSTLDTMYPNDYDAPEDLSLKAITSKLREIKPTEAEIEHLQDQFTFPGDEDESDKFEFIQDGSYIKGYPKSPLTPGANYLVVVKSGEVYDNELEQYVTPLKSSSTFNLLKSEEPLTEATEGKLAQLEPLRKSYSNLYDYILEPKGTDRDDTLQIFTFSTAEKTLSTSDFTTMQNVLGNYTQSSESYQNIEDFWNQNDDDYNATGLPYSNLRDELARMDASINATTLNAYGLGEVNSTNGTFTSWDITTLSDNEPETIQVPYTIYNNSTYNSSNTNNDVVIFQHGIFGKKENAKKFADNHTNDTVISMDLPKHGERTEGVSGADYFGKPTNNRINMYQSYYDMTVLLRSLKYDSDPNTQGGSIVGKFDINKNGSEDTPDRIFFVGNSLGSVLGSTLVNKNYISTEWFSNNEVPSMGTVTHSVLNVGGANVGSIIDQTRHDGINKVIEEDMGLEKNTTPYLTTMGIMQLLVDPADPAYWADGLIHNAFNIGSDEPILTTAYKDTIVSNTSSEILSKVAGGFNIVDIKYLPPYDPSPDPRDWAMFGGKEPTTGHWIPHSFMLTSDFEDYDAETKSHFKQGYVEGAHDGVNDAIDNYLP
ncbi:MAG: hypothetical protein ACOCZ2_00600 [Thermodesulfobacteriota bacterium]